MPPQRATSKCIISTLRALFVTYGVPEELSSDGGPQFKAHDFGRFLAQWGVSHRNSSAEYPQSNGRAELGVKSAKRIIRNNTSPNGSLDNDNAARAIMTYRNTPLPYINLSPAQILFHRQLKDHLPTHSSNYHLHKEWVLSAKKREEALAKRNMEIVARYNQSAHELQPLSTGTRVLIQSNKHRRARWNKTGVVVECLPHRQYQVKVLGSGRITLRNRRFLKPAPISRVVLSPQISPTTDILPQSTTPTDPTSTTDIHQPTDPPEDISPITSPGNNTTSAEVAEPSRTRRALKRLETHNTPGLREAPTNATGRRAVEGR